MKKIGILCLVLFLLVGCMGKQEGVQEEASGDEATMESLDDSYYKIINLDSSELRERFYTDFYSTKDFETIGRDLQLISSQYFSTSNHYMSEGQYFGREQKRALVVRNTKSKYSIQPKKGTTIDGVKDPVMVSNIHEQDYYVKDGSKYTLKGISLAVVLDPKDSNSQTLVTPMSDSTVKNYGKECIAKVYDFIQKEESLAKIKDLPILITIYQATDKTRSTLNGKYIYSSYCHKSLGSINDLNYRNVIFSSSEAESIDKITYAEFNEIKNNLKSSATEAAGLVGEAKYIDGEIQSMIINANLNIKTITELQYLTSLLADNIDSKFTYDFDIKILVNSQDGLKAVIIKDRGQKAKSSMLY
ncbi:MAG: hypothetical protein HFF36_03060 [Coprobacillus sp.]|nr:hypothetical protein [Coprobacillus sp.]MCI9092756.1 hypothetical protein [Coprobacillus sp.]